MIWVHCGNEDEVAVTCSLVTRIAEDCDSSQILVTISFDDLSGFDRAPAGMKILAAPLDTNAKGRAFLEEWSPQSLIWVGGVLRPALLKHVARTGVPAIFVNARSSGLFPGGSGWFPGATRNAVAAFDSILTVDKGTALRLTRGGVPSDKIKVTGPILEEPMPLVHDQYEFVVMAEALDARPVWLAADVVSEEITAITKAHLDASRKNHRLLLILTPRDTQSGAAVATALRGAGLKVGLRSDGDDPDAEHQAYVADIPDELGLWYRLAPLVFVGGTLDEGAAACPLDPILLGCAVVHGPHTAPHEARFERLARADASCVVHTASELGTLIETLISPEQTARIALNGWEDLTASAETINRLVAHALNEDAFS